MFGEFQFGAGEFAGTQAIPIPTPVTPTTITRLKLECATVTCATETDVGVYSLQDEIPSRSVAAAECLANECSGVDPDVQSYSLQDALYFNGTPITVPVICPVGADCTPGSFPPTITFPPGTFVIPDVPTTPGQPIILQLTGCQSTVSVTLPATATQAEINAAVNYIIEQVALQQAQCDSFPEFPFTTSVSLGTFVSAACLNSGFAASISGSSSPESYPLSFGIVGGSLPPGISLTSSSSTVAFFSGTPTVAGNYTFTLRAVTASGAVGTRTYNIAIGGISTASLATAITGEDYLETLTATGISGTLMWGIAGGSLPPGLTLNSSTGVISGIPTTEDSYPVTIFVQNSFQQCTRSFTITVDNCVIDNASPLPEATAGEVYSTTLTASDITGTLTWSIIAGALPNGLSLNAATGEISGTPDTDGTYNFTAQVTSGDNTCQKAFELEVETPSTCPDWTLFDWTSVVTIGSGVAIPAAPGMSDVFETSQVGLGAAQIQGAILYSGSGCDCNLHVEITKDPGITLGGLTLFVNAVIVASYPLNTTAAGVYDFPFTLPDTGGGNISIDIICGVQDLTLSSSITGILSNVP